MKFVVDTEMWDNDLVQFARLLDEIRATQDFSDRHDLFESMDLTAESIEEIFDRATKVWERAKAEREFLRRGIFHEPIPDDFPVRPLVGDEITLAGAATMCGHCLITWDDSIPTSYTPAPSARCPFETFHLYPEET